MRIVKQSAELIGLMRPTDTLSPPGKLIERAGRVCWKSEDRITEDSHVDFVDRICNQYGHESVAEHSSATFHLVTNRAIANELVRHRIAAYSQESTRYCNYSKDKFGGVAFIEPEFSNQELRDRWYNLMVQIEQQYLSMVQQGVKPEVARDILPLCLKTEIVATMNFRSWKHVIELRTSPKAHYQIQELIGLVKKDLLKVAPEYFGTKVN
jgi:thymidylate synthase (FAD)